MFLSFVILSYCSSQMQYYKLLHAPADDAKVKKDIFEVILYLIVFSSGVS